MWPQNPLFSGNFDFGAKLPHEIFLIANPNFSHVQLMTFPHGKKIPALRAGITSSKIFHAVRAGFLLCFECIVVNIIKILLSQHEKSCWK
jgi:hypothetical protein